MDPHSDAGSRCIDQDGIWTSEVQSPDNQERKCVTKCPLHGAGGTNNCGKANQVSWISIRWVFGRAKHNLEDAATSERRPVVHWQVRAPGDSQNVGLSTWATFKIHLASQSLWHRTECNGGYGMNYHQRSEIWLSVLPTFSSLGVVQQIITTNIYN